jgi:hypothetical protein
MVPSELAALRLSIDSESLATYLGHLDSTGTVDQHLDRSSRSQVALDYISKTHSAHGVDLERLGPPDTLGLWIDEFY